MDEKTVAQIALEAFTRETGLPGTLLQQNVEGHDCNVQLAQYELNGAIKRWASHNLPLLLQKFSSSKDELLLADYINANVAKKLQAAAIQFIDMAGNAFIDLPNLKVRIRGNKPVNIVDLPAVKAVTAAGVTASLDVVTKAERIDRALQPKGLMVIYHLLTDNKALTRSMRDIAQHTGVAHGTVGIVLTALENGFFLRRDRKGQLVFHDRKGLIERWVQGYAEKLAPKLLFGYFLHEGDKRWGDPEVSIVHGAWGGEVAAREYTQYLQPQIATLYVPEQYRAAVMQEYRLRQAPKGTEPNFKLMRNFWDDGYEEPGTKFRPESTASPLLTYAELIASGDSRNLEAARMIHDNDLASS
ncbi:type IV toxin-antitoxin system AbiEi family antitoxin [Larsenimonas rhizosphaerae]|uniref:Type IV toxin-antitoxin system AbiEi family antitoxin n=1 Tax=Larsenimonas rhizosphaerae TaxID=2944682 RepID=A0AA41ZQ33_9GAMM|nr:type IV toxin-antitoxin system AbiEi family antitoxin [Larsenimonas rhizosphaerae]MCX2525195.1 type IV toxin-antitoxin system AbiEi family antitoxin [Larsenimonas rhizosphaerae]